MVGVLHLLFRSSIRTRLQSSLENRMNQLFLMNVSSKDCETSYDRIHLPVNNAAVTVGY